MALDNFCRHFGVTPAIQQKRIAMLNITAADAAAGAALQSDVLIPNVDIIMERFYEQLLEIDSMRKILEQGFDIDRLKQTQRKYLLSFGVDVQSENYFEHRLRVGYAHYRVGLNLVLYQCAFGIMQDIIFDCIPSDHPKLIEIVKFVSKVANLDMSLAIESYYDTSTESFERSIAHLRRETSELSHKVSHDTLTGLFTRGYVMESLEAMMSQEDKNHQLSVVMVDIDYFMKWIESDNEVTQYDLDEDGIPEKILPTNNIRIPVDKEAVLKNGIVAPEDADLIVPYIDINFGQALTKNRTFFPFPSK